jgi:uncharacterized protein
VTNHGSMDRQRQLIVNLTSGRLLCHQAVIADRPVSRMRGLLGRSVLPNGEGLLLRPAASIHTAFMKFPIDAVFADRDLRIVKLVPHLRPWHMAAATGARAVLELAEGEIERNGLAVGHMLATRDLIAAQQTCAACGRTLDPSRSVERLLAALFSSLGA